MALKRVFGLITGTESVTIVRRTLGVKDEYGLPGKITEHIIIPKVLVGFGPTNQPVSAEANPQVTEVTLYFPNGTQIEPNDEFLIRGELFVKDGRVMDWQSPFIGFDAGVVVNVRQHLG